MKLSNRSPRRDFDISKSPMTQHDITSCKKHKRGDVILGSVLCVVSLAILYCCYYFDINTPRLIVIALFSLFLGSGIGTFHILKTSPPNYFPVDGSQALIMMELAKKHPALAKYRTLVNNEGRSFVKGEYEAFIDWDKEAALKELHDQ